MCFDGEHQINDLVGGLEHEFYDYPYVGNVIIPTDEHIFQRGRYTTNQNEEMLGAESRNDCFFSGSEFEP